MNRTQLEHIIRAAAGNADADDIVVAGSQASLGSFPDAPAELLESMEADVFPRDKPDDSILIDGGICELSPFHQTFGYAANVPWRLARCRIGFYGWGILRRT